MRASCILVTVVSILLWVDRLPAPIVEEEKPKPAAEQSEAPKRKRSKRSTTTGQPSAQTETRTQTTPAPAAEGPARFAGTWSGTINQGVLGDVTLSLSINASATSVQEASRVGTFTHPTTIAGTVLTWKSGWLSEINWTFAPNNDGKTAAVTSKSPFGVNGSATFRKQ